MRFNIQSNHLSHKIEKAKRVKIPSKNQIDSNQSSINAWYFPRKKSIKQSVSLFITQEYQSYGDIISTNKKEIICIKEISQDEK